MAEGNDTNDRDSSFDIENLRRIVEEAQKAPEAQETELRDILGPVVGIFITPPVERHDLSSRIRRIIGDTGRRLEGLSRSLTRSSEAGVPDIADDACDACRHIHRLLVDSPVAAAYGSLLGGTCDLPYHSTLTAGLVVLLRGQLLMPVDGSMPRDVQREIRRHRDDLEFSGKLTDAQIAATPEQFVDMVDPVVVGPSTSMWAVLCDLESGTFFGPGAR